MSLLKVSKLAHSYGDNVLLREASFDLFDGEKMGLVGLNGTGKSTLLKIIMGEVIHESGDMEWRPRLNVGYLDQYREIDPGNSIRDYLRTAFAALYKLEARYNELNAMLMHTPDMKRIEQAAACQDALLSGGFYEIDDHIERVCAGLGITELGLDKEVAQLSGGQRAKVILAKLLLENPDVLIMDEPTNFLDEAHIEWLTGFLKNYKGAFIVVSHHFDFLDRITNCICEIEFQTVTKYRGNLSEYLAKKDMRRQEYIREYTAQRRWIEKMEDYIARNKVRAATANMAKGRAKMLSRVDRLPPPKQHAVPSFRFKSAWLGSGPLLNVDELEIGYDHPLLPKLSFKLNWGSKIAVTGFNGIGKTTLIRTLLGEISSISGRFNFHESCKSGYFQQEPTWKNDSMTPLEYIAYLFPALAMKDIHTALAQAGISGRHVRQRLSTLSGGEQAKVRICQLSLTPYNLLVLDEPTNHLDAAAKTVFHEALTEFKGSVILITHEKSFCEGLTDKELDIEKLVR